MNALCVLGSLFLAAFGLVGLACYALGRLCGKSEAGRENGPNAGIERPQKPQEGRLT